MTLNEAIAACHVRSAVMRESNPNKKYWKNHPVPILQRIPLEDAQADDWVEYDPRDHEDATLDA